MGAFSLSMHKQMDISCELWQDWPRKMVSGMSQKKDYTSGEVFPKDSQGCK